MGGLRRNRKNRNYYPGYFRAKLMAGDAILKEHDIQITTDGWLSILTAPWGKKPLYFKKEETEKEGQVEVSKALLEKYGVELFPDLPELRFYNQKDISGFPTDNFEFETEIPNNPVDFVGVQYRFEGPGAIRNTRLKSGEKEISFD